MSIFRIKKTINYTVISNIPIRDKNLSLKAKGLLAFVLSLPDDWTYSIKGLEHELKENHSTIVKILAELEKYGYFEKVVNRGDHGRFKNYEYIFYEVPKNVEKTGGSPYSTLPHTVKPHAEKPHAVNRSLLNKDIQSKEEQSTDLTKSNCSAKPNDIYDDDIKDIVSYLNKSTGKHFSATSTTTRKLIHARLVNGATPQDLKDVIDLKVHQWADNDRMRKYLRPNTLFRESNFENYIEEVRDAGDHTSTTETAGSGTPDSFYTNYDWNQHVVN